MGLALMGPSPLGPNGHLGRDYPALLPYPYHFVTTPRRQIHTKDLLPLKFILFILYFTEIVIRLGTESN